MTPLAISIGEAGGIGPDLILQIYSRRGENPLPAFIVYGNLQFLRERAKRLRLAIKIETSTPAKAPELFSDALPVMDIGEGILDNPGIVSKQGSEMAMQAIIDATKDCLSGDCRALITAPINKKALMNVGFKHPGHTEFLAHLCSDNDDETTPIMMLANADLRVVPLTIHVALSEVPKLISVEMILRKTRIVDQDLKSRFGIPKPKIAICGLNPHAGEEGAFGREEIEMISPAIALLKLEGVDVYGPFPADTAFYPPNWRQYDVVIAMYHDQALIPIKTIAFEEAINITLGLPIVRTSPDHGTAFDIAGKNIANTKSMLAAILAADEMTGDHKKQAR